MTPLSPDTIRESFAVIREIVQGSPHPHAVELVDMFERRLLLDESLLALNDRIGAPADNVYPFPMDEHSVKVPDTYLGPDDIEIYGAGVK